MQWMARRRGGNNARKLLRSRTKSSATAEGPRDAIKAKFHYAIWFEAGSRLVADRLEAGSNLSATSFEPASNQIA